MPRFVILLYCLLFAFLESTMDPELDEIIRTLPADFDQRVIDENRRRRDAEKRQQQQAEMDEIIRALPNEFFDQGRSTKRKADGPESKRRCLPTEKVSCDVCQKSVSRGNLAKHQRIHAETCYDCPYCMYQGTKNLDYLKEHVGRHHSDRNYKCAVCGIQYAGKRPFFDEPHLSQCIKHIGQEHPPVEPLPEDQIHPFFHDPIDPPSPEENGFYDDVAISAFRDEEAAVEQINRHWKYFRQQFHTNSSLVHSYTYRLTGPDVGNFSIENALRHVYSSANAVFNVNAGISTLLMRTTDDDQGFEEFL